MKRILLFCTAIVLPSIAMVAQTNTGRPTTVKPAIMRKSNNLIKETPAPAPVPADKTAPATPATAPQPLTAADYKLTNVRVKINTGRDNKETPSEVYTKFCIPETGTPTYLAFAQWNLQSEMPINAEIEVGLRKLANANLEITSTKMTMGRAYELHTGGNDISLADIQKQGAKLFIYYCPHLFTDAWRVENVTILLEFKDNNGNPHPVHGSKSLSFSNAKVFLNGLDNRYLVCEVGTDISAMVAYPKKD
jgi:hypothetical protein